MGATGGISWNCEPEPCWCPGLALALKPPPVPLAPPPTLTAHSLALLISTQIAVFGIHRQHKRRLALDAIPKEEEPPADLLKHSDELTARCARERVRSGCLRLELAEVSLETWQRVRARHSLPPQPPKAYPRSHPQLASSATRSMPALDDSACTRLHTPWLLCSWQGDLHRWENYLPNKLAAARHEKRPEVAGKSSSEDVGFSNDEDTEDEEDLLCSESLEEEADEEEEGEVGSSEAEVPSEAEEAEAAEAEAEAAQAEEQEGRAVVRRARGPYKLIGPWMTSEEALEQAQVEGLTLRAGGGESGYFGVSRRTRNNGEREPYYQARVIRGGKQVGLGTFATAEEAALCVARSPEGQE